MQRSAHGLAYRADIDGLRAVAVLSVLGFHAFPGYVPGGFLGVDIFFVLSGYLITGLILADAAAGRFSLRDFYARRIRRLFPAALTVIAATLAAGYLLLFSHEFARLAQHGWASLFFYENLLLSREVGYFDVEAVTKPLLHFWSLAVEEQYYLVWPLALAAALAFRRVGVVAALIATALCGSFLLVLVGDAGAAWRFYSPLTRAWELATGAALAWQLRGERRYPLSSHPLARDVAAATAMTLLAACALIGTMGQPHPGWITLLPVGATAALLALGPDTLIARRLLALRPAVWVGLISYPLYLWHWPLLSYAHVVLGDRGATWLRAALLLLALALAAATYRWVEKPLRFSWPRRRAVTFLLAAALLLAAAIGAAVLLRPAGRDRAAAIAEQQLEGVAWRYTANDLCRARHREHFTAFCMQQGDAHPAILFIGNSYANHLFPGFARHSDLAGVPMLNFGNCDVSRTSPVGIFGPDQCDTQFRMLREYRSVRLVIVANQWPLFDRSGRMTDLQEGDPGRPSDYPNAARYARALQAAVAELAAPGVPVVIFGLKPELGYDVAACYGRPLRPAIRDCRASRAHFEAEAAVTREILANVAAEFPNVYVFDLAPLFCDDATCSYRAPDGTPYLRDGNGHFSAAGSRYVAAAFMRWARANGIDLPNGAGRTGFDR